MQNSSQTAPSPNPKAESDIESSSVQHASPQSTMAKGKGGEDKGDEEARAFSREDKGEETDEPTRLGIESINIGGRADSRDTNKLTDGGEPEDTKQIPNSFKREASRGLDHRVQLVQTEVFQDSSHKTVKEAKTTNLADSHSVKCTNVPADQAASDLRQDDLDVAFKDFGRADGEPAQFHQKKFDVLDKRQKDVGLLVEALSEIMVIGPEIGSEVDGSTTAKSR